MQPTQISDLRVEKTSSILRLFLGGRTLTRKEIETRTGISYGTISIILRQLLAAGILQRTGKESSSGGRRADTYQLVQSRYCFAQVSVTSYGFVWSVRDLAGTVVDGGTIPDDDARQVNDVFGDVVGLIIQRAGSAMPSPSELVSIGVSVPGHYRVSTDTIVQPSRERVADLRLQGVIGERYDGEVVIESDVNAAAFVEITAEDGLTFRDGTNLFVAVTADGVGASIILNGAVHYGATGHAGEIHMIPVTVDGTTLSFGDVVDTSAIASYLAGIGAVDAPPDYPTLRALIADGDQRTEAAYPRLVEAFSQAIFLLDSMLDPDRIVLAGPYTGFGGRWSRDIAARVREISESNMMDEVVLSQTENVQDLDLRGLWRIQTERWCESVDEQAG